VVTPELVTIVSALTLIIIVMGVFLWRAAGRQQSQPIDTPLPVRAEPLDTIVQDTAIQAMSARLASVEGRIGTIAATMEGIAVLQQRVAAIEVNMPAVQDAYEKYADQISRADKRNTERQRRTEKLQGQSAGDAAAALTGAAVDGGNLQPTQAVAPTNQVQKRPGILGGAKR